MIPSSLCRIYFPLILQSEQSLGVYLLWEMEHHHAVWAGLLKLWSAAPAQTQVCSMEPCSQGASPQPGGLAFWESYCIIYTPKMACPSSPSWTTSSQNPMSLTAAGVNLWVWQGTYAGTKDWTGCKCQSMSFCVSGKCQRESGQQHTGETSQWCRWQRTWWTDEQSCSPCG